MTIDTGNFFNAPTPGRARGIEFFTPGLGFQVSAASGNPTATPTRFGNLNPTYPGLFAVFSPEKLFTPIGSNVTDATFFVPGAATPATVSGFGAVFTDVDLADTTTIQFRPGECPARIVLRPLGAGKCNPLLFGRGLRRWGASLQVSLFTFFPHFPH